MAGSVQLSWGSLRTDLAGPPPPAKQVQLTYAAIRAAGGAAPTKQVQLSFAALLTAVVPRQVQLSYAAVSGAGSPRQVQLSYAALSIESPNTPPLFWRSGGQWRAARLYVWRGGPTGAWVLLVDNTGL